MMMVVVAYDVSTESEQGSQAASAGREGVSGLRSACAEFSF